MAQKTRARQLKAGAKFTDAQGKRHGGGDTVHLTIAQEWNFRDQLVPSGPGDPTAEPNAEDIEKNEGRETIAVSTPAAAPAAPAGTQAAAPAETGTAAPQGAPDAQGGAQTAPEGGQAVQPSGEAHPIHDLTVAEAQELVASAGTPAALDALEAAELGHPKHDGGRVGVKRAIESRRAELAG